MYKCMMFAEVQVVGNYTCLSTSTGPACSNTVNATVYVSKLVAISHIHTSICTMHFVCVSSQDIRMQLQDRLELADYLILPVSRITRWSLLLSDFRKQSARSALPAGEVDTALTLTRGISRQANNAIHLDMLEGFSKMEVGELVLLVSPVLMDQF